MEECRQTLPTRRHFTAAARIINLGFSPCTGSTGQSNSVCERMTSAALLCKCAANAPSPLVPRTMITRSALSFTEMLGCSRRFASRADSSRLAPLASPEATCESVSSASFGTGFSLSDVMSVTSCRYCVSSDMAALVIRRSCCLTVTVR